MEDIRICSKCGKEMYQGYCIDNGLEYYCSDECLHSQYTSEEYQRMYDNDDAYWTEWEEIELTQEELKENILNNINYNINNSKIELEIALNIIDRICNQFYNEGYIKESNTLNTCCISIKEILESDRND